MVQLKLDANRGFQEKGRVTYVVFSSQRKTQERHLVPPTARPWRDRDRGRQREGGEESEAGRERKVGARREREGGDGDDTASVPSY